MHELFREIRNQSPRLLRTRSFIPTREVEGRGRRSVNKIENESTFPLVCYTGHLPERKQSIPPIVPESAVARIRVSAPGFALRGSCKANRATLWPRLVRSTMHWGRQSDTKGSGFLSFDSPLPTWRGVYRWPWRISLEQSYLRVEYRGWTKHPCVNSCCCWTGLFPFFFVLFFTCD